MIRKEETCCYRNDPIWNLSTLESKNFSRPLTPAFAGMTTEETKLRLSLE